jgi:signal transduction histidine kinase
VVRSGASSTASDGWGATRNPAPGQSDVLGRTAHALAPWLLAVCVLLGVVVTARHPPYPVGPGAGLHLPAVAAAGLVVASALAAGMARRRRWPLYAAALAGWLTLSAWPAVAVAGYYTVVSDRPTRRRTIRITIFGMVTAVLVAVPLVADRVRADRAGPAAATLFGAGIAAVLTGLPIVLGLWVDARRRLLTALHDRAEQLQHDQAARAERARVQERARIAHEMHDVVAHQVSLMVLQAGALEVSATDQRSVAAAGLIRTTGREALAELRQVLDVLRSTAPLAPLAPTAPQPALAELDRLIDLTRAAGIPIQRRDEWQPPDGGARAALPPAVQRAAYRVVQEGLTNVAKHAGTAPTTVVLRHLPGRLEIVVSNPPPPGPRPDPPAGGLGLIGLGERVGVLGGSVVAGATPDGGFSLRAEIPFAAAGPIEPGQVAE